MIGGSRGFPLGLSSVWVGLATLQCEGEGCALGVVWEMDGRRVRRLTRRPGGEGNFVMSAPSLTKQALIDGLGRLAGPDG